VEIGGPAVHAASLLRIHASSKLVLYDALLGARY
jgi:hypothetical protein